MSPTERDTLLTPEHPAPDLTGGQPCLPAQTPTPGADQRAPHPPAPAPAGGQVELAPEVLEGELLGEDDNTLLPAPRVRAGGVFSASPVVQLRALARYRARQAPRDLARLCWFALRGHARWTVKAWVWATYADLRADVRAARLAGDAPARRAAQELIRADAHARWTKASILARRLVLAALLLGILAAVLGLVNAALPREAMWPWLATLYTLLGITGVVLSWVLKLSPLGWLTAAVWEGRDRTPGAGFLLRPTREDPDSFVDERMISQALAHLGITPLDRFFKNGGALVYTIAARLDGDGTAAQIRLPLGVSADMVAERRTRLAANLGRKTLETWPTEGPEAGILDLWVADKGKLGQGAGEWPLLHEGSVDIFEGVPIGKSLRGKIINAPLFECNYLVGGKPGQGKTNYVRVLTLGAALDPTEELWVFVMGESSDFKPLQEEGRLSRYAMGMTDTVVHAAVTALDDLLIEMERRGKALAAQPGSPPRTSRKLANKPGLGLHHLTCVIDECHEMYQHPKYGAHASEASVRLIKRGRKYGISLVLATQSPTKDSIPREVTRNISCGVAFCVGDHVANDGLLGSGKYRAGIRATDLRFNVDRGTSVTVGLTDANFELLNGFYVPFDDGIDQVTPVVRRAMTQITQLPHTQARPEDTGTPDPTPDHLADIAHVLAGQRRVLTRIVLTRLADHNPTTYEGWTFTDLKTTLAAHGIEAVKSDGLMVIRSEDITHALTHRDHDNAGESGSVGSSPWHLPGASSLP